MPDIPIPPEQPAVSADEFPAVGDTVLVRAVVRLVGKGVAYVQVDGPSPNRQLWINAAEIEGRPIHSPRAAFRTGDRVKLTGTVVAASGQCVIVLPDHHPVPTPAARLRIEPGYLWLIDSSR